MTSSQSNSEISEKMQVVVVDDERLSSHNLAIQLKFVGESPLMSSSENWRELTSGFTDQGVFLAAVVGVIKKTGLQQLLLELHQLFPNLPVLLIGSLSQAEAAAIPTTLQAQLHQIDEPSLNFEALTFALRNARDRNGLRQRQLQSKMLSPTGSTLFRSLSGNSKIITHIRQIMQQVAKRDVPVLVIGESGTGKEVVARNLHYHSGRGAAPFIAINCASINADNYGIELFGQAADKGQTQATVGLLEKANGGTIYFDEVGELPLNIQTILLRFLEDKTFYRSGSGELISVDAKVVAGSGQDLEAKIKQGLFRRDLYYRLNLMPISLPPLRKRLEDIPELVKELLRHLESKGYNAISLNASAVAALQKHKWLGNVRELANLIERLCIMNSQGVLGLHDLPYEYQYAEDTEALLQDIEAFNGKQAYSAAVPTDDKFKVKPDTNSEVAPAVKAAAQTVSEPQSPQAIIPPEAVAAPGPSPAKAAAAPVPNKPNATSAMMPLNEMVLQHYLFNFEKQLLLTALDDCANILSFAAERLNIEEDELMGKIKDYNLESF